MPDFYGNYLGRRSVKTRACDDCAPFSGMGFLDYAPYATPLGMARGHAYP